MSQYELGFLHGIFLTTGGAVFGVLFCWLGMKVIKYFEDLRADIKYLRQLREGK